MRVITLLAGLWVLWASSLASQTPVVPAQPQAEIEEIVLGTGQHAAPGFLVTVHFIVRDSAGREVANSERRGLPYTFEQGARGNDFWSRLAAGMRTGGERLVKLPAELAFGSGGVPPIAPPGSLEIRVKTLRVAPKP
jgi:peptidylprolyl isomerase